MRGEPWRSVSNEFVTGEDQQRPDGDGKLTTPAGQPSGKKEAQGDRPIATTSPWSAGTAGGWWTEDSATPATTATPTWRQASGSTPSDRELAERPTDELAVVTVETPAVASTPAASARKTQAAPAPSASAPSASPASPDTPAQELPVSLMEDTVPIWRTVSEESAEDETWLARRMRPGRHRGKNDATLPRPRKPPKPPRHTAAGLVSTILLSLLAAFFAWVSAEPLWLALGRGESGTVTVTECTGSGVNQRCVGTFTADGGAFTSEHVRLLGVDDEQRAEGTQLQALMVDRQADSAYIDSGSNLLHLRWAIGLSLVLLCGVGIVWGTGALRLADRASRWKATLTALGAPVLLALGFVAAAAV